MEFLDTPDMSAAQAPRPPRGTPTVQFEAAGAAATPDGAEAGGVAPETPLPRDAARPLLAESGHLGRPLLRLRPDETSLISLS